MVVRRQFDTRDYEGAVGVLENYLDGALADFENGDVDNYYLIDHSINTLELIQESVMGFSVARDYRNRFVKALEKNFKEK